MATIRLPPDFKEFLQLLNAHHVEYLLIGSYSLAPGTEGAVVSAGIRAAKAVA
jgi:hypothetical protein